MECKKAGGEPIDLSSISKPNFTKAMECAVLFPHIIGDDVVGSKLTGEYYLQPYNLDDDSTYQWYRGDSRNGVYEKIVGATEREYNIKDEDLNKYIRFEVTPKVQEKVGEIIKSDPVGSIMSVEEFSKISPRLKKNETYIQSHKSLTSEIDNRFNEDIYFTVDEIYGGTDKTPVSFTVGSSYYYKKKKRIRFNEDKPSVVHNKVMVNKAFVQDVLEVKYDFDEKDSVALDDVIKASGKYVFYGTEEIEKGSNGNYRSTAQAQGLIIISDKPIIIDVVKDRDVLNEMVNQVYDLRASGEELQWFRDAKFGMFIHWEPCSLDYYEIGWGRGTGPRRVTKVPEYDLLYKDFNPVDFDAEAIVDKAIEMGCKYLIFTSKHHGGWTSWDTNFFPEHSIMGTPYAKDRAGEDADIIKQIADAAHAKGLKFGLYYSPQDWYNDYCWSEEHYRWMETYLGHLTELFSEYGKMDIFWCDGIGSALTMYDNTAPVGWKEAWGAWDPRTILRRVKQLQPSIITNDRYAYRWEDPKPWDEGGLPEDIQGDYITPEQTTASFNNRYAWESCLTIDAFNKWSYNYDTPAKDPLEATRDIVSNACNDGNVLLNIGLMSNGKFSNVHLTAFEIIGKWVVNHGESLYYTRGGPYIEQNWGGSTYRKNDDGTNTVYLHISPLLTGAVEQNGNTLKIILAPDGHEYSIATLLDYPDKQLGFEKKEDGYLITLPEGIEFADGTTMDSFDTVIKLEENFKRFNQG